MAQALISTRFQRLSFAIVAFAFNEAAYASETIRAAILSVDPGEIEAARSLGNDQQAGLYACHYPQCSSSGDT